MNEAEQDDLVRDNDHRVAAIRWLRLVCWELAGMSERSDGMTGWEAAAKWSAFREPSRALLRDLSLRQVHAIQEPYEGIVRR